MGWKTICLPYLRMAKSVSRRLYRPVYKTLEFARDQYINSAPDINTTNMKIVFELEGRDEGAALTKSQE
jgi:hypothetical protein